MYRGSISQRAMNTVITEGLVSHDVLDERYGSHDSDVYAQPSSSWVSGHEDEEKGGSACGLVGSWCGLSGSVNELVIRCMAVAAMTSLLLGYDQGVMSGAKLYIAEDLSLSEWQVQLLVGILHVSAVGALFAGWMSDRLGRKMTVAVACVVFLIGGLMMSCALDYNVLMIGRVITGVGVGTGLTIAPLYMAELSPKAVRGALVSLNEVSINVGVLLGFIAGWAFSGLGKHESWRWMLGMGCLPPVVIGFFLLGMPESPRWLVKQGRREEALLILQQTCGQKEAEETLESLAQESKEEEHSSWRLLFRPPEPGMSKLVLAGIGVAIFQQASGLEALV